MALESCGECGREMSSSASSCPHCGWRRPNTVLRVALGIAAAVAALAALGVALIPDYEVQAGERRRACEALVGDSPYGLGQCSAIYQRDLNDGQAAAQGSRHPNPQPHAGCREEKFAGITQYVCE
jgi:DNA-binding transcriptional LysR family regulator